MTTSLRSRCSLLALALVACGGVEPPPVLVPGAFVPVCGLFGRPAATGFECQCDTGYYDSGSSVGARCIPWGQAYDDEGHLYWCVHSMDCGRPAGAYVRAGCGDQGVMLANLDCTCVDGSYNTDAVALTCERLACGETAEPIGNVCVCRVGYYPALGSDPVFPTCVPCRDGGECAGRTPAPPVVSVPGVWTAGF